MTGPYREGPLAGQQICFDKATAVSCPMDIKPGERLGQYRLGGEHMIFDEEGRSRLSMEDFAVALVDEVQQPRHVRQQVGAAY